MWIARRWVTRKMQNVQEDIKKEINIHVKKTVLSEQTSDDNFPVAVAIPVSPGDETVIKYSKTQY